MQNKFTVIPTAGRDEMRATLEQMKRQLPVFLEYTQTLAKIRKTAFDAHVAEGFSEDQALELCKTLSL